MTRDSARSLLLIHARSGQPMHPRTYERALAAAEWDADFERQVRSHAAAHQWDRERERQDREFIRPFFEVIRERLT